LKEATKLYGISILTSTERYETPQELRIEGSENGTDWVTLPLTYQTHSDYAFSPVSIKYIKLILEQNSDEIAWTVNDVMFHVVPN